MCAKVWSKKYYLVKQGLQELEAKKGKGSNSFKLETAYIVEVKSSNTPNPHSLPLANPFAFNLFFSILPDIISNNIPISFP